MFKRAGYHLLAAFLLTLTLFASALAQSEKKAVYGVLLDNTGSLKTQFPQVLAVGKGAVKRIHLRGPVSLFNFITTRDERNAVVTSGIKWSQDENALNQYIDALSLVEGHTTLMDAIYLMAEDLKAKVNADKDVYGDKVIILITDGEDKLNPRATRPLYSGSSEDTERKKKEKQIIKALRESEIKVHAVGLVRELNAEGGFITKSRRETAETFLKKITKETGGRVVFPKSKKVDIDSVLNELLSQ